MSKSGARSGSKSVPDKALGSRTARQSRCPCLIKVRATAAPIPLLEPVITTVLMIDWRSGLEHGPTQDQS